MLDQTSRAFTLEFPVEDFQTHFIMMCAHFGIVVSCSCAFASGYWSGSKYIVKPHPYSSVCPDRLFFTYHTLTFEEIGNFYRPQRSCEGYVFTPICLSTGGGGLPQCMLGYHPLGAGTPPGPGTHPGDQAPPWTRHPPRPGTPRSRHPRPGGTRHPPPGPGTPPTPADGYCCGRYASYWNAFFFYIISC